MLDLSEHINNKARWVKGEFDDKVEAGFSASQLFRDTMKRLDLSVGNWERRQKKPCSITFPMVRN